MGSDSNKRTRTCLLRNRTPKQHLIRILLSGLCVSLPLLWWTFSRSWHSATEKTLNTPTLLMQPPKLLPSISVQQQQRQPPVYQPLPHGSPQYPPPLALSELTNNNYVNHEIEREACESKAFVYIDDIITNQHSVTNTRKIPAIVHQTSKSRCLTQMFAKVSHPWRSLDGYDYHLHDDAAMLRLLVKSDFGNTFPLLHDMVAANCLPSGTLKADLWRYLVLWEYGGFYADIDTQPTSLFNTTQPILTADDDGWFVVEQFHVLSQYVMAVSPKHPLMYYAIHHALNKVMAQSDTGRINAALVTGPHALHRAYQDFRKDAGANVDPQGPGFKPVWAGRFQGTHQRSITVVGRGEFEGEYIQREMMSLPLKKKQYAKMNMTSFREDKLQSSGQSCLSALLQYHHQNKLIVGGS